MILKFYKKEGRWYNDDPNNGFDEANNEMVAGVPEVIEAFVGKNESKALIVLDTNPFSGAYWMNLVNDKVSGGVEYEVDFNLGDKNPIIWLCQVFWCYFDKAPKRLYFKVRRG